VLIVEDDDATRELLRRTLAAGGYRVQVAGDGRAGIDCVSRETPALVVLDLMMPEVDGFQFLDELRAQPRWRAVPVVVVTAKELTAGDLARLNGGVQYILEKERLRGDELVARVRDGGRRIGRGCPVRQPSPARGRVAARPRAWKGARVRFLTGAACPGIMQ
jgi:DNA-binding response OmpR family regulator